MSQRDHDRLDDLGSKLDKRFDELQAEIQEMRADVRGLGEKLLSIKA